LGFLEEHPKSELVVCPTHRLNRTPSDFCGSTTLGKGGHIGTHCHSICSTQSQAVPVSKGKSPFGQAMDSVSNFGSVAPNGWHIFRLLRELLASVTGVRMARPHSRPQILLSSGYSTRFHCAPQPNCRFNADANIGHRCAILMAYVGALQPSASGAG
jgi:hypothetical protein